ncbi:MAG: serine/threonine protein kinase [Myxococcales bacterium]|nr:serine/threonine protein kinase [Myxococcales bacterium]
MGLRMGQFTVTSAPDALEHGTLPEGTMISAYRLGTVAGVGGMGWVYRASHTLSGRTVALKVMREEQLAQERAIDRMMREASILASVSHPGIPRFFECGLLEDRRPWIAMELIEGVPLADRMHRGLVDAAVVMELVDDVAGVLAAAHDRGVTHRDLKPDNIFLTAGDAACGVRIIDWGIAHHYAGARFTNMNEAIGTPTYMAPEQARGGPTNGHCDVYGLGVVAYQALTGRPPFVGATSVEILVQHLNRPVPALAPRCPDAPYGLVELVEHMLAKNFEERPSATEVQRALAKLRVSTSARMSAHYPIECDDGVPLTMQGDHAATTAVMRSPRAAALDD